jgi:nucleotide-binding universal stress UspA family protein
MSGSTVIIGWLGVVVVSGLIAVYLARRWGHDPFGWAFLTAALGPLAIVAQVGPHQRDRDRRHALVAMTPRGGRELIVLATDGSEVATQLAAHVSDQGRQVVVLHVLPYELGPDGDDQSASEKAAQEAAGSLLSNLREKGVDARLELRYGPPGQAIVDYANESGAGLIVVGRRGSGLARALLGSTSRYVVEHASQPVFVAG